MIERCKEILAKPFFRDFRTLAGLWLLLGVLAAVMKMHSHNNLMATNLITCTCSVIIFAIKMHNDYFKKK